MHPNVVFRDTENKILCKNTESPMEESMQENGTERKTLTHELIVINYAQINLGRELRRQFLALRTIIFCNISQMGKTKTNTVNCC